MEEGISIRILFGPEETQFYNNIEKHCLDRGISTSIYIKELIKRDLGWGQFMKPRKSTGVNRG